MVLQDLIYWRFIVNSDIEKIINDWDPIGLFPIAPKDEYYKEIEAICLYLETTKNLGANDLAMEIDRIFTKAFGKDVYNCDARECTIISEKILNCI